MSLGPVKPVSNAISVQMGQAWIDPVDTDAEDNQDQRDSNTSEETQQEKNARGDKQKNANNNTTQDAHRILKKAVEAELPKVNILDQTGKKVVPDVSGMVINILT